MVKPAAEAPESVMSRSLFDDGEEAVSRFRDAIPGACKACSRSGGRELTFHRTSFGEALFDKLPCSLDDRESILFILMIPRLCTPVLSLRYVMNCALAYSPRSL